MSNPHYILTDPPVYQSADDFILSNPNTGSEYKPRLPEIDYSNEYPLSPPEHLDRLRELAGKESFTKKRKGITTKKKIPT